MEKIDLWTCVSRQLQQTKSQTLKGKAHTDALEQLLRIRVRWLFKEDALGGGTNKILKTPKKPPDQFREVTPTFQLEKKTTRKWEPEHARQSNPKNNRSRKKGRKSTNN